jgi:hypothetical protein
MDPSPPAAAGLGATGRMDANDKQIFTTEQTRLAIGRKNQSQAQKLAGGSNTDRLGITIDNT